MGIDYIKAVVGDKYVYEYVAKNSCRIDGEQSSHIIFSKYASLLTSMKIRKIILAKKKPMSELVVRVTVEASDHNICLKYVDEVVNVSCEKRI